MSDGNKIGKYFDSSFINLNLKTIKTDLSMFPAKEIYNAHEENGPVQLRLHETY